MNGYCDSMRPGSLLSRVVLLMAAEREGLVPLILARVPAFAITACPVVRPTELCCMRTRSPDAIRCGPNLFRRIRCPGGDTLALW